MDKRVAVVLAAGRGTRMKSERPKVLHPFGGRALVEWPIQAATGAGFERICVVVGYGAQAVEDRIREVYGPTDAPQIDMVLQAEQRGTGHAVACALPRLPSKGPVVVLCGDVPLLRATTLTALVESWRRSSAGLALVAFRPADATGYGRLVVEGESVARIVEHRDATEAELQIDLCNAGTYCFEAALLHRYLPELDASDAASNAQGEVYLTDVVERAAAHGSVLWVEVEPHEAAGVNTPEQLVALEAYLPGYKP